MARVREFAEFCKTLRVKKIGVAFCIGLIDVARCIVKYLENLDFVISSVACECGAVDRSLILGKDVKMRPLAVFSPCAVQ